MVKIAKLLGLFCMVAIGQPMQAQFSYSPKAKQAQNAILNLNFTQYGTLRSNQKSDEAGIYLWLDGYAEFVNYFSSAKKINSDSVIYKIQASINKIKELPKNSPFYYYTLTDLNYFLSFLYFEKSEHFSALQHYLKAKGALGTCLQNYPDFEMANKQRLVQIAVNNIINKQLGVNLASDQAAQKSFIDLLNKYLQTNHDGYKRELKLLGIFLFNMQYSNNYHLIINCLPVDAEYAAQGPIEALTSATLFKKADLYHNQMQVLKNAYGLNFQKNLNLIELWYGLALLNVQNDSAAYHLNAFLTHQQTNNYVNYAQYKLAMYWFLKTNKTESQTHIAQVKQLPYFTTPEDEQAVYEINHANYWTSELVLARVLFDGGEFKRALDVLLAAKANVATYNNQQKLEYSYRLARIYDKFGDIEKAKKFYLMVVNSKLDAEFYYPAYSAFYLGNLYDIKGEPEKANECYKRCLELDSPIYKASIHQKAKVGLK